MKFMTTLFLPFFLMPLFSAQSQEIAWLADFAKTHNLNGTVLIQQQNDVIFHQSFGLANRSFHVPATNTTRYKIASITKAFTAVLILQLYEQGKIDLEAPIRTYLPDYTGKGGDKIKIHNLLNHTSGMPYVGPTSKEEAIKNGIEELQLPHNVADLITTYYSRDLVHEVGSTFSYNNGEYIILGKIIETLYGAPFSEVLAQQILQPLEMHNSGLLFQYQIVDSLADTYFTKNDSIGLVNDMPVYIENWYAAGAMYSTAADLLKFSNALFGGRLLQKETLARMLTPGLDNYGYGLWVYDVELAGKKHTVVKRPGAIMGAQAMLVHLPQDQLTIILLANTDLVDLDDFSYQIIKQMLGEGSSQ